MNVTSIQQRGSLEVEGRVDAHPVAAVAVQEQRPEGIVARALRLLRNERDGDQGAGRIPRDGEDAAALIQAGVIPGYLLLLPKSSYMLYTYIHTLAKQENT
jgi:hypothetical protein